MPIDFSQFQKKEEPKEIVQEPIIAHDEIIPAVTKKKRIKVLADRKKNKFQIADRIHKLLVNDAKRSKAQQKILMEKYRSTLKDLELYETR